MKSPSFFFPACCRSRVVVCSQHSFLRYSSVRGRVWSDWGHVISLYLRSGACRTQDQDGCWKYDLPLPQRLSNTVCPHRVFLTRLEAASPGDHSTGCFALSLLEVRY